MDGVVEKLFKHPEGLKSLVLWDVATGEELQRLSTSQEGILSAAFSPDDNSLAVVSETGIIQILAPLNGSCLHTLRARRDISEIAFSPDGKLLIAITAAGI